MATTLVEAKKGIVVESPAKGEAASENGKHVPIIHRPRRLAAAVSNIGGKRVVGAALGGLLVTAMWVAMFTVGLAVPSQPFRDGLLAVAATETPAGAYPVDGPFQAIYALVIVAFTYTPTNLVLLCCLASLVGCLGYAATTIPDELAKASHHPDAGKPDEGPMIPLRPAISAVTWGFFIYLFLISGTLIASQNPFSATSPDQYLRLAGTASLLSFVVGWRPEVISRLVSQIGQTRLAGKGES